MDAEEEIAVVAKEQGAVAALVEKTKERRPGVGGGLDVEPATADEGAGLAVVGAERAEDEDEELLREVRGAVLLADGLGDEGEELRCHRGEGWQRGRGLAVARAWRGTGPCRRRRRIC